VRRRESKRRPICLQSTLGANQLVKRTPVEVVHKKTAQTEAASLPGNKRTKERTIADIIEKVSLWRKLYNGVVRDGTLVRYSLEDAAVKVDVSKKSLDDYLL